MELTLMEGNEAIGWGAMAAGCNFFAGYPITPATEVMEWLAKYLPRMGGALVQAVLEPRIIFLGALRANGMGKLGFGMILNVLFDLSPIPLIVSNLMAVGANR